MAELNELERRIEQVEKRLVNGSGDDERPPLRSYAFGLLAKLEERFRQQERELAEARARIRDLERANEALTARVDTLLATIEGNMDEVDEIMRRLTKVARDVDLGDDESAGRSGPSGTTLPALPPTAMSEILIPPAEAEEPVPAQDAEPVQGRSNRRSYAGPILDINALFAKGTSRGPARG